VPSNGLGVWGLEHTPLEGSLEALEGGLEGVLA
jgi:hypothetical protein